MLYYSLSQFLIKIITTTTTIYLVRTNYLKIAMINKFLYKLQMLYDDRIEVAEAIYVSKTSASKERDIYYYWYFLDNGF